MKRKIKLSRPKQLQPLHSKLLKFLCGNFGLFIVVCCLALGGAMLFMYVICTGAALFIYVERDAEELRYLLKRTKARDMHDARTYFASYWWHFATKPNLTFNQWQLKVVHHLDSMDSFVVDAVAEYKYDGTVDGWTYDWTITKALLFTITIMTTIGYGHIYPRTPNGQFLTIAFALIGTPVLLVFLANIGDCMAQLFTFTYSRICCRWCRSTRYLSERVLGKRAKRVSEDTVGKEPYMPTDQVQVPVVINLVLIGVYLSIGAIIFSQWESWNFTSAYYFSFVTLSTIGFGDMVPGNSFLDKKLDGFIASVKMAVTIVYCLLGMALISMCIQMMQEQVLTKVRWLGEETGLLESENQRQVVSVRRSKPGQVPETKYLKNSQSRPSTTNKPKRGKKKKSTDESGEVPKSDATERRVSTDATELGDVDKMGSTGSIDSLFNLA